MNKFRNFLMVVFVVLVVCAVQPISALSGNAALGATAGDTTRSVAPAGFADADGRVRIHP